MSFILSLVCVSHVPLNVNAKNVLSHDSLQRYSPRYTTGKIKLNREKEDRREKPFASELFEEKRSIKDRYVSPRRMFVSVTATRVLGRRGGIGD